MFFRSAVLLVALTLAACAPRGDIRLVPQAASVGHVEPIFIGSSRGPDPVEGQAFGISRTHDTRFARLDVSVPPTHEPGVISWPRRNRPADPAKDFVTTKQVIYDSRASFRADLSRALAAQPDGKREAVIFIHGFNNTFAEGAYRLAQLGNDLKVKGTLVHYSWPSRANALGYVYDRDSALFARDGLEDLLDEVTAAGARKIIIVAHSMGSAVAVETLRQIAIGHNDKVRQRIAGVVLMSPDIDIDLFHAEAEKIGDLPQPFIIFTSSKDRALNLSARITGQHDRLGNLTDPTELSTLKVTLVDTSVYSSGLGHFTVGDSPALLSILGKISDVDSAFARDSTGKAGLLGGAVLTVQNATQIVLLPVTAIAEGAR